jgi:hypothetical protein
MRRAQMGHTAFRRFIEARSIIIIIIPQKHKQKYWNTKHCKYNVYYVIGYTALIRKIQKNSQSHYKQQQTEKSYFYR